MKKNVEFPSEQEMKRDEEVRNKSDKFVADFVANNFPGKNSEDEVSIELGELCAHLHSAFQSGSSVL